MLQAEAEAQLAAEAALTVQLESSIAAVRRALEDVQYVQMQRRAAVPCQAPQLAAPGLHSYPWWCFLDVVLQAQADVDDMAGALDAQLAEVAMLEEQVCGRRCAVGALCRAQVGHVCTPAEHKQRLAFAQVLRLFVLAACMQANRGDACSLVSSPLVVRVIACAHSPHTGGCGSSCQGRRRTGRGETLIITAGMVPRDEHAYSTGVCVAAVVPG